MTKIILVRHCHVEVSPERVPWGVSSHLPRMVRPSGKVTGTAIPRPEPLPVLYQPAHPVPVATAGRSRPPRSDASPARRPDRHRLWPARLTPDEVRARWPGLSRLGIVLRTGRRSRVGDVAGCSRSGVSRAARCVDGHPSDTVVLVRRTTAVNRVILGCTRWGCLCHV